MAQLVKCLVHRPGGLSSYPPAPVENSGMRYLSVTPAQ